MEWCSAKLAMWGVLCWHGVCWQGQGIPQNATRVQLPTFGVAVDAEGVLSMARVSANLSRIELPANQAGQALQSYSPRRFVSLTRLAKQMATLRAAGDRPDDAMRHLAGLQRIEHVYLRPTDEEIILAGPAEGLVRDQTGRALGRTTLRPTLTLDDLCIAMRAFAPDTTKRVFVGCTISPDALGLQRLAEFQQSIPNVVRPFEQASVARYVALGMQRSLGMSRVQAFGIPEDTRFAQKMIEADYRMKRIGIGREPKPRGMTTYVEALSHPRQGMLQRWWFVPEADSIEVSPDGLSYAFLGNRVRLRTEEYRISDEDPGQAGRRGAQPASRAARAYATSFSKQYPEIAAAIPAFADLQNLIDLLVLAALLRRADVYQRWEWSAEELLDDSRYPISRVPVARRVAPLVQAVWKGNRLIAPAGGVSIVPEELLDQAVVSDKPGPDDPSARPPNTAEQWWWDPAP